MRSIRNWAGDWARRSNARAVDNAREASIACARRAVERHEVELLLAQLASGRRRDVASVTRRRA